jgi:carbamate kinase
MQSKHAREAAAALRELVNEEGYALCVTHGNGPQVGQLALQVHCSSRTAMHHCASWHAQGEMPRSGWCSGA